MEKRGDAIPIQALPVAAATQQILRDGTGQVVDGIWLEMNDLFLQFTGLKREQLRGQKMLSVLPEVCPEFTGDEAMYGKREENGQELLRYLNHAEKWFMVQWSQTASDCRVLFLLESSHDPDHPFELAHFFDMNPNLLCIADTSGRLLRVNRAWSKLLGFDQNWLEQQKFLSFVHPGDLEATQNVMEALESQQQVAGFVNRYRTQGGYYRFIEWYANSPRSGIIYAAARDITEQKNHEEALQLKQRQLRTIIDAVPNYIFAKDENGRFLLANQAFAEVFGMSPEEVVGKTDRDWGASPALQEQFLKDDREVIQSGEMKWIDKERANRKDGSPGWFQTVKIPYQHPGHSRPAVLAVATDISDRVALEERINEYNERLLLSNQELNEALTKALESSQAKSEFLANMSHEIRTPLNAVIGMNRLAYNLSRDEELRGYLEKGHHAAQNLLEMLDEILNYSRIEAGKMEIDQRHFSVEQVVKETVSTFEYRTKMKGLSLQIQMEPFIPRNLRGDPLRIRQVLMNLISNAIKFTDEGTIDLEVQVIRRVNRQIWLQFSVSDTGMGIEEAQLHRLFEPFTQGDGSSRRNHGGTGLGLSIARQLVELMGGEMKVSSTPGKGSSFSFQIPAELTEEKAPYDENVSMDVSSPLPVQEFPAMKGQVLVVEDNSTNQQILREFLRKTGLTVTVASRGEEALQRARENIYDLVVMDVQMPGMDGLTATRALREIPGHETIPVIAMTAHTSEKDRQQCLDAGMNDFLVKPFDPVFFLQTVKQWMGQEDADEAEFTSPLEEEMPANPTGLEATQALRRVGGQWQVYLRLLDTFLEESDHSLRIMEQAKTRNDTALLRRQAHYVKGMAANIGATEMARTSRRIQEQLQKESFEDRPPMTNMDALIGQLSNQLEDVRRIRQKFSEAKREAAQKPELSDLSPHLLPKIQEAEQRLQRQEFLEETFLNELRDEASDPATISALMEEVLHGIRSFDYQAALAGLKQMKQIIHQSGLEERSDANEQTGHPPDHTGGG